MLICKPVAAFVSILSERLIVEPPDQQPPPRATLRQSKSISPIFSTICIIALSNASNQAPLGVSVSVARIRLILFDLTINGISRTIAANSRYGRGIQLSHHLRWQSAHRNSRRGGHVSGLVWPVKRRCSCRQPFIWRAA